MIINNNKKFAYNTFTGCVLALTCVRSCCVFALVSVCSHECVNVCVCVNLFTSSSPFHLSSHGFRCSLVLQLHLSQAGMETHKGTLYFKVNPFRWFGLRYLVQSMYMVTTSSNGNLTRQETFPRLCGTGVVWTLRKCYLETGGWCNVHTFCKVRRICGN